MRKISKLAIFFVFTVLIIIICTTATYAFWSGSPQREVTGSNSPNITVSDSTYKYIIFEANISGGRYFLKYSDTYGKFVNTEEYNDGDTIDGITAGSFNSVSVFAYTGGLGEYESLQIPSSIKWRFDSTNSDVSLSVTKIDMQTSGEFAAQDLIKSVVIPLSVTEILGVSFSAWGNLDTIYFDMTSKAGISIGQYCFISSSKTISCYIKDNGGQYVSTSLR